MWLLKDLLIFGLGIFFGWFFSGPDEEEAPDGGGEEVVRTMPINRNPLYRAAAGARSPSGKEPSA